MRYTGEDRDVISKDNRLLVQRGNLKKEIANIENDSITGVNSILDFDYMGSSEFGWGALPRSLRRMTLNKDFYSVVEFPEYKDKKGNTLKGYVPRCSLEHVKKVIDRLVVSGHGLQEYCSLCDFVVKEGEPKEVLDYCRDDNFWWDIENDFFMFFEHTDKVLAAMEGLEKRKFGYDKSEPKAALSGLGIRLLEERKTKPYLGSYVGNSLINNYKYDEDNGIHFIEFINDSNIENVLMEAMLISKVDLGQVLFGINGIDFNINDESTLIEVVSQSGVNLADKIESSKTVAELEADVRTKKGKQRELCYVLRQITDKKSGI